jgi:hypothetical protein
MGTSAYTAVINDRQLSPVAGAEQPDLRMAGVCVRDDVVQSFLCHPIQAERDVRGNGLEFPFRPEGDRDGVATLELGAVGGKGGYQPGVRDHAGMQVV